MSLSIEGKGNCLIAPNIHNLRQEVHTNYDHHVLVCSSDETFEI